MVKRDVVGQKIARATAWVDDAERRLSQSRDAFLADAESRDLALFHLFLALQECIDLATHWIADDELPPADDYGAAFDILAAHGRLDGALATAMKGAASLRNLIAHGYASLDPGRVHGEARLGLGAVRRFLDAVARAAGI